MRFFSLSISASAAKALEPDNASSTAEAAWRFKCERLESLAKTSHAANMDRAKIARDLAARLTLQFDEIKRSKETSDLEQRNANEAMKATIERKKLHIEDLSMRLIKQKHVEETLRIKLGQCEQKETISALHSQIEAQAKELAEVKQMLAHQDKQHALNVCEIKTRMNEGAKRNLQLFSAQLGEEMNQLKRENQSIVDERDSIKKERDQALDSLSSALAKIKSDAIDFAEIKARQMVEDDSFINDLEPEECATPATQAADNLNNELVEMSVDQVDSKRFSNDWFRQMEQVVSSYRLSGLSFDNFELLDDGGFSDVFKCKFRGSNGSASSSIPVAVKVFKKLRRDVELGDKAPWPVLASVESHTVLSNDSHCQFVPKVYGVLKHHPTPDRFAIVSELIEGVTLQSVHTQLPVFTKVFIAWKVLCILQWMHAKGILWGDLKASNILVTFLTDLIQVKFVDFDSCQFLLKARIRPWTLSFGYSSPEVFGVLKAEVGTAADVFSYGYLLEVLFDPSRDDVSMDMHIQSSSPAKMALIRKLLEISARCQAHHPSERCSLQDVESVFAAFRWTVR